MEVPSQYNAKEVEDKIYRLWEESGFFNPDKLPARHKKPFTIIMPPPNGLAWAATTTSCIRLPTRSLRCGSRIDPKYL